MATHQERAQAILDALANEPVASARAGRILDDFVWEHRSAIEAAGLDPDNLTNAQKSSAMLDYLLEHAKRVFRKARVQREAAKYVDAVNAAGAAEDL